MIIIHNLNSLLALLTFIAIFTSSELLVVQGRSQNQGLYHDKDQQSKLVKCPCIVSQGPIHKRFLHLRTNLQMYFIGLAQGCPYEASSIFIFRQLLRSIDNVYSQSMSITSLYCKRRRYKTLFQTLYTNAGFRRSYRRYSWSTINGQYIISRRFKDCWVDDV